MLIGPKFLRLGKINSMFQFIALTFSWVKLKFHNQPQNHTEITLFLLSKQQLENKTIQMYGLLPRMSSVKVWLLTPYFFSLRIFTK